MPLLLTDAKLLFLHIPKTGGNWVRKALDVLEVPTQNIDSTEEYEPTKNLHPMYPRFTAVRNPLDWYPSYWANVQIFGTRGLANLGLSDIITRNPTFESFVEAMLIQYPNGYCTEMYKKYIGHNTIFLKTETLKADLCLLLIDAKVDCDLTRLDNLEHENRCASKPEYADKVFLPERLRTRLIEAEIEVFETYGYDAKAK